MASYRLSNEADADITAIAEYTLANWSEAQVDQYLLGLHEKLQRLPGNPSSGKSVDDLKPGYLRYRYRRHMIFYKGAPDGIFVVRVLHAQMDFLRHL